MSEIIGRERQREALDEEEALMHQPSTPRAGLPQAIGGTVIGPRHTHFTPTDDSSQIPAGTHAVAVELSGSVDGPLVWGVEP